MTVRSTGIILAAALLGAPAIAQDRTQVVAGWKIEDLGGKPGDSSDRTLGLSRKLGNVALSYAPGQDGGSASFVLKFEACNGFTFSTGFQYDDPPATHLQNATAEIAESYEDFATQCKEKFTTQAELMKGFGEALATAEKWLVQRPFVYPPEQPDQPRDPGNSV